MLKSIKSMLAAFCAILLAGTFGAFAQNGGETSVQGIVKDVAGPIVGATVITKDGTSGTTTSMDGSFTLNKVKEGDVIVISFIGYQTQEIPYVGQTMLDVTLQEEATALNAVVVTALGIKREEKALSYNVQQVKSDEITTVKDANFMNSLVGKVAGVTINAGAGGAGTSSRVIMRGMKSLEKSNAALYVIDGIPMYNNSFGGDAGGTMTAQVGSESIADINPEDIESINMLTGPSAAALYGSDAANGVVLINTKRGAEGKTTVTISNTTMFSKAYMLPEMQNRYGTSNTTFSWGDKINGTFDAKDFFNTGTNIINSVSLSTGTQKNQTYISVSTTNAADIIPEAEYNRYNFTARNTTKFAKDKLTFDFGASFVIQNNQNQVSQGKYYNPLPALYLFPRGDDFDEIRLYERWDPVRGYMAQYWPYGEGAHSLQNPYWIQNRIMRETTKRRYMLNASLKWDITDWLDVTGRVRIDNSDYRITTKYYASTLETFAGENGGLSDETQLDRTFYGDVMANINKTWGDWSLSAQVGASINDQRYERSGDAGDLKKTNLFTKLNLNTENKYKIMQKGWHDQTQAIFANVEVGWRSMLYLTVTGRNDWASQLAYSANSSFFYPSVGLSAVVSNMFNAPKWLSFLKVRASYSQVASAFARYLSNPSYTYNEQSHGWSAPTTYPNTDLQPEMTKSWEVGVNARFINKFNLDITYYRSNTYDQTIYMPLASSTGYQNYAAQTGNIQNQGIELSVGYNNKWGDFRWATNFTYSFNENKIIELAHGMINPLTGEQEDMLEIRKDWLGQTDVAPRVILREGGSMTDIYINHEIARDLNGNVLIDPSTGKLSMTEIEPQKVGQLAPKGNLGWSNNFSYKGIDLGIVFTARLGGKVYSATQGILDYYGVSEASAAARDRGGVPVNFGSVDAQTYYQTIATAEGGHGAYYLYDATNVRLQELSLSYTLPAKWFRNKARLSVGFVAKNLWMIYCKAPFDPEMSAVTGSNYYQGVDYFMLPSMRNLGFNVKLQF